MDDKTQNPFTTGTDAQTEYATPERSIVVDPNLPTEENIRQNLRQIYDPEIGLEVVQLGLIRDITVGEGQGEIKMLLTTPFCPYGGWLIQQVKDVSEAVAGKPMKLTVLPDLWDPSLMEDPGLLSGW